MTLHDVWFWMLEMSATLMKGVRSVMFEPVAKRATAAHDGAEVLLTSLSEVQGPKLMSLILPYSTQTVLLVRVPLVQSLEDWLGRRMSLGGRDFVSGIIKGEAQSTCVVRRARDSEKSISPLRGHSHLSRFHRCTKTAQSRKARPP